MSRIRKKLGEKPDYTHLFSIGFFAKVVPKPLIQRVLTKLGLMNKRIRLFPATAVVYFVMAMPLFRGNPLEEIVKIFTEIYQHYARQDGREIQIPTKSAISQARSRLGSEAMRLIADEVLRPIAPPEFSGAWYRGMRLMSLDGSCFDTPDESENINYFGYASTSRGEPAFPQARILSLVETGTRVVTAAEIGPYRTSG